MLARCVVLALLITGAAAAPATAASVTAPAPATEGGALVFSITRDTILQNVTATTVDGTATAPGDYTPRTNAPVTFGLGSLDGTFTVQTADDEVAEGDETVSVDVTFSGGGPPIRATATIKDDEPVLAVFDARASEAAGAIDVVVARPSIAKATTFAYATAAGSATAGADFTPAAGRATIPANADRTTIRIPVADDTADEDDETVAVTISAVDPATIARAAATATIADDDQRTIAIADASTTEGDTANTLVRVPVTLNAPTFRTVTVQYATVALEAKATRDYLTRVGTLTIAPGQQQAFVDVPIVADDTRERTERFAVLVGRESGARVVDGTALVSIADDDAAAGDETPPHMRVTRLRRSKNVLAVRVQCPKAEQRCAGRVTFYTRADRRSRSRTLRRERRLGRRAFTLRGGQAKTVKLTLRRSIRSAARRAGRLRVRAFVVTQDASDNTDTTTKSATLRFRR